MIKLFAILTVLAALPVSALANPSTAPFGSVHCDKDVVDNAYTQPGASVVIPATGTTAASANDNNVQS